jgi:hypothetical protein
MKGILSLAAVALIAAISSVICARLEIPVWTMFIGWIAFVAGGMSSKTAAPAFVCAILGVVLGFIGTFVISNGVAAIGPELALLVGVFIIVFAALLAQHLPFANLVICYFIGMTTYFASGLAPGLASVLVLGSGLFVGIASGLLAVSLSGWMMRESTESRG